MKISLVGFSSRELAIGYQLCEKEGHLAKPWPPRGTDNRSTPLTYLRGKKHFLDKTEVLIIKVGNLESISFLLTALRQMLAGGGPSQVIALTTLSLDDLLAMGEPPEVAGLTALREQGRFTVYGDFLDGLSTALEHLGSTKR